MGLGVSQLKQRRFGRLFLADVGATGARKSCALQATKSSMTSARQGEMLMACLLKLLRPWMCLAWGPYPRPPRRFMAA